MGVKEAFCPECDHRLKLGARPHKGQRINCPSCAHNLTIVGLDPIELSPTLLQRSSTKPKKKARAAETSCPECDAPVKIGARAQLGQLIKCSGCKKTLEVIDINPLEVDIALPGHIKI